MKYANITHLNGNIFTSENNIGFDRLVNIGDYIQILAIDNLYNYMGIKEEDVVKIEYYELATYDGEYVVLPLNFILFNPHYIKEKLKFSPKIIPVFLGVSCISLKFSQEELDYLRQYAPIGCRDEYTLKLFREASIPAYLNGCLTATLPRRIYDPKKMDKVFFVDISNNLKQYIPKRLLKNCVFLSHQYYGNINNEIEGIKIDEFVKKVFNRYKEEAALVVTSRLHCASPCIAMGIPVIFASNRFNYSFAWIERLINVYTKDEFHEIDWNPQPLDYESIKQKILDVSAKRITETYKKYKDIFSISSFYENRNKKEYIIQYTYVVSKHAEKYWSKLKNVKYGFWGVTQITELVYEFINKNYPNAELVVVFDKYRQVDFHGIKSSRLSELNKYDDICIIATGNSSCIEAREIFKKSNRAEKYYCLCFNSGYEKIF